VTDQLLKLRCAELGVAQTLTLLCQNYSSLELLQGVTGRNHLVVCLTTGPKPLPKRALHIALGLRLPPPDSKPIFCLLTRSLAVLFFYRFGWRFLKHELLLSLLCLRAMDYRTWAEITCGLARLIAVYINCFRRGTAVHGLVGEGA